MELSLTQAAQLLGKTRRQVEYLIQTGKLTAHKAGGRWRIAEADLPLSPGQREARARRGHGLRDAVDEVLERTAPRARYSMRDLKAFQEARALWVACMTEIEPTHPARGYLRTALEQLALGCHRYDRKDKAAAYNQARDAASLAACALLVDGPDSAQSLVQGIENTLIPAIAGLMRRADRARDRG